MSRSQILLAVGAVLSYAIGYPLALSFGLGFGWVLVSLGGVFLMGLGWVTVTRVHRGAPPATRDDPPPP